MISKRSRSVAAVALLLGSVAVELPAQQAPPRRGVLWVARLRHVGNWDVAPMAIPNVVESLRKDPRFKGQVFQKDCFPHDPNLVHYPLVYMTGDANFLIDEPGRVALRRHLTACGGTLFADAHDGSPAFDTAFRRLVAELIPESPLVPIPRDDKLLTAKYGSDLADVRKGAPGDKPAPAELEGVKVAGRWAVIYSKQDLGAALDNPAGVDHKGYAPESASKIATNVVRYATEP